MNLATVFHRYSMHGVPVMTITLLVIKKDTVINNFLHWIKHTSHPELTFVYQNRIIQHIIRFYDNSEYTVEYPTCDLSDDPVSDESVPDNTETLSFAVSGRIRLSGKCLNSFPTGLLSSIQKQHSTERMSVYSEYLMRSRLEDLPYLDRVYFTLCYILQHPGQVVNEFRKTIKSPTLADAIRHDQNSYVFAFAEYLMNIPVMTGKTVSGRGSVMRSFLLS